MARALLNFGCMAVSRTANLRDDNNGTFIDALLLFQTQVTCEMTTSRPSFLLGWDNRGKCIVEFWLFRVPPTSRRQQNLPKIHVEAQLESRWRSNPEIAQLFALLGQYIGQ